MGRSLLLYNKAERIQSSFRLSIILLFFQWSFCFFQSSFRFSMTLRSSMMISSSAIFLRNSFSFSSVCWSYLHRWASYRPPGGVKHPAGIFCIKESGSPPHHQIHSPPQDTFHQLYTRPGGWQQGTDSTRGMGRPKRAIYEAYSKHAAICQEWRDMPLMPATRLFWWA